MAVVLTLAANAATLLIVVVTLMLILSFVMFLNISSFDCHGELTVFFKLLLPASFSSSVAVANAGTIMFTFVLRDALHDYHLSHCSQNFIRTVLTSCHCSSDFWCCHCYILHSTNPILNP